MCSSVYPTCNASSEGERSTLDNSWLEHSPKGREEWHHHNLYYSADKHTRCCYPEWDSCSAGPTFRLTSVACSQPHWFEAIHQIRVESCSHNHCWGWSIYKRWGLSPVPYIAMEWVVAHVAFCYFTFSAFIAAMWRTYVQSTMWCTVLSTLHPIAPGPVFELSYEESTNTSVTITWKPPKEPNGDLVAYFVEHGVYQNESTRSVRIDARRRMSAVIQALGKLVLLHMVPTFIGKYMSTINHQKGSTRYGPRNSNQAVSWASE